jgi:hypothetical protein
MRVIFVSPISYSSLDCLSCRQLEFVVSVLHREVNATSLRLQGSYLPINEGLGAPP